MRRTRIRFAAIAAIVVATTLARADGLVPDGLQPGDTYHLVFVTEGTRDATSTDIADYNAFVRAEAARTGAITEHFGIEWYAIGSTARVDAKDNAVVEGPVYLLDGLTKVADGFEDVWDAPLGAPIDTDQFGSVPQTQSGRVITATVSAFDPRPSLNGTAGVPNGMSCPLGGVCTFDSYIGDLTLSGFPGHNDTNQIDGHMYALSQKLTVPPHLQPGDADMDLDTDQLDLVKALQAAKYLTGQPATWGEGDWNGGPGGYPGEPPAGDGLFDQHDIVAALQTGTYLAGPYAVIRPGGVEDDDQTLSIDDARPADVAFAQPGLFQAFVRSDLAVVGSLDGAGGLGGVDSIYVPEPTTLVLLAMVAATFAICRCVYGIAQTAVVSQREE